MQHKAAVLAAVRVEIRLLEQALAILHPLLHLKEITAARALGAVSFQVVAVVAQVQPVLAGQAVMAALAALEQHLLLLAHRSLGLAVAVAEANLLLALAALVVAVLAAVLVLLERITQVEAVAAAVRLALETVAAVVLAL
jgi:hypothetical protein